MQTLEANIRTDRIHLFKFILEGYDGLAVLSTLDEKAGRVRLTFPAEARLEVDALLHDLAGQIGLVEETVTRSPRWTTQ